MEDAVLAVVANYAFSNEADDLKARLKPHYETVLVDSGSPRPPRTTDISLPNVYYSGLWTEAVRVVLERRKPWLLFVASDVQVPDTNQLAASIRTVLGKPAAGVYTPSLRADSRLAFSACFCRGTGRIRECFVSEGFFFLVRTSIVEQLYPIDRVANLYGWGVDIMTAAEAYRRGRKVLVDDRVVIYHPAAIHAIPIEESLKQQTKYVGDEGWRFLNWARQRGERPQRLSDVPRRVSEELSLVFRRVRTHHRDRARHAIAHA